ncbi:MAG: efflux RND transporter permease subunit [Spirochaetales bacterium]|nr:efflux RND transporter permease subunit [Spirochaetales bacterium]
MKLPSLAVKHPITIIMVFCAMFILGMVSMGRLGQEMFPDVTLPAVSVVTVYPGVGPVDVESGVTKPVENAVSTINGVTDVSSTSSEGVSIVTVYFSWSTDMNSLVPEVREQLTEVENLLPEGAERPRIYRMSADSLPTMTFNISTQTTGIDTRELAEDVIAPALEKIEGVAQAAVYGGLKRAVICKLNLDTLSQLEIPLMQVLQVFQGENISLPGGTVHTGGRSMILRTVGEFASVDDIGYVLVGYRDRRPIFMNDIADIQLDYLPQEEFVRAAGVPGVMVSVRKQPGYNTVTVNQSILSALEDLKTELPPSIHIGVQSDQSVSVLQSIGGVVKAAWQGGLLAILVLLLFLRNLRSTLIISIVIPVSVVATLAFMDFAGLTLNIASLMGITLGVGMFVDNAIVVLEANYRKQLSGRNPEQAAEEGTAEVGRAITASTLTTVAVFVPMVFIEGMAGIIFKEIALTICFALFISLAVALTLIPVFCMKVLKIDKNAVIHRAPSEDIHIEPSLADVKVDSGHPLVDGISRRIQKGLQALDDAYGRALAWALRHTRGVVASAVILLILSIGSVLLLGMEFLPETDEAAIQVALETRIGSSYKATDEKVLQAEEIIKNILKKDLVSMTSRIGEGGGLMGESGSNLAVINLALVEKDDRQMSVWEVMNRIDREFKINLLDVKYEIIVEGLASLFSSATGESSPVVLEFSGDDIQALEKVSAQALEVVSAVPGLRNVRTSHSAGKPEIQFRIKRKEALSLGISPREIAATIRTAYKGTTVTRYSTFEKDYDVLVMLREEDRNNLDRFGTLFFVNPGGSRIPVENLVEIVEDTGPLSIRREDKTRIIKVTASLTGDRPLSRVMEDIKAAMELSGPVPFGVTLRYTGSNQEMEESFRSLFMALLLAVALVYMVMASQFESLLHPLIIMFSVPFAAIGLVAGLLITGTTFSILAFLGAILLVGIVVNNAIVLVDYINQLRGVGVSLEMAIIKGGKTRLKPILMTSLTTILGLLPMALGLGTGSELRAPMGRAVVGGLTTSTLVTLILIPVLYWMVESRREKRKPAKKRKKKRNPYSIPSKRASTSLNRAASS